MVNISINHFSTFFSRYKKDVERYTRILEDSANVERSRTYPSKVKIFYCNECSFQSKSKRYLRRHTIIHKEPTKLKMFKCNKCSYQSKWRADLNKHLPLHNESRKGKMLKSSKYIKLNLVRVEIFNVMNVPSNVRIRILLRGISWAIKIHQISKFCFVTTVATKPGIKETFVDMS